MRKAFERYYEAQQMPLESDLFRLDEDGEYSYGYVQDAWEAYYHAKSEDANRIADLERELERCRSTIVIINSKE